jgi:hypothetical protein
MWSGAKQDMSIHNMRSIMGDSNRKPIANNHQYLTKS